MNASWLLAAWLWPLAIAVACRWSLGARLLPVAALPAAALAWGAGSPLTMDVPWLMVGGSFALDARTTMLLRPIALVWLAAAALAAAYPATRGDLRFAAFFCLALAGNVGLVLAADALELYLFFALMSFAAYGLVVHDGSPSARHAGRRYLQLVIASEVLLFGGLALVLAGAPDARLGTVAQRLADPAQLPALVLITLGFGVKAGLLPLHVWLPLAHPAAPTPASAALSGAMINAGVVGWLQLLPLGRAAVPWAGALVVAGLAGAFYGVVRGLRSREPKIVLAYSSVSQMGTLAALVGVALGSPAHAQGLSAAVAAWLAHHAVAKAALFLGLAVHARRSALAWACVFVPALALAGLPLTTGAAVKAASKAALAGGGGWAEPVAHLLPVASAATTLLLGWFVVVLSRRPAHDRAIGLPANLPLMLLAALAMAPLGAAVLSLPSRAFDWFDVLPIALGAGLAWALRERFWQRARPSPTPPVRSGLRLPALKLPAWGGRQGASTALDRLEAVLEDGRWIALGLVALCVALVLVA